MNRIMRVKLSRVKFVAALEKKLAEIKRERAQQEANEKKFEKLEKEYLQACIKALRSKLTQAKFISPSCRGGDDVTVSVTLPASAQLPKEPQRDFQQRPAGAWDSMIEEIEQALRLVAMSDAPTISTSAYDSVMAYL